MSLPGQPERCVVHYRGRVQGVGFRYTVQNVARRYEVTGFVQNLPDGRVKLVVEGRRPEISELLDDIAAAMEQNIQDASVERLPASDEFTTFEIRL